jgi:hypothetical protein
MKKNKTYLFLDDWRYPIDCTTYMFRRGVDCRIYHDNWIVVRSYGDFIEHVLINGVPNVISFDYDLADVEELREELPIEKWFDLDNNRIYTGGDCANWLRSYCNSNGLELPEIIIHSANPDGSVEIKEIFKT